MGQQIINKKDIKTSDWSGGTTAELFIYPPKSDYKKLDFAFRLSKATIEVEESVFTPLPNVKRKLMLLDGELELIHDGAHTKKLKPLQFDTFSGDWNTKSVGKATDFNLMMIGVTDGNFSVIKAKKKQYHDYKITDGFTVFYIVDGTLNFEDKAISKGELLIFDQAEDDIFKFNLEAGSKVIVTRVNL